MVTDNVEVTKSGYSYPDTNDIGYIDGHMYLNHEQTAAKAAERVKPVLAKLPEIEIRMIQVGRQMLRVGIKPGAKDRPPLLLFNGIGANLELAGTFMRALPSVEAIIFDIPGIGGSPAPSFPYRPSTIAKLAANLVAQLGYDKVDVAGISWGGGMAQQFAHQYPDACRKLILMATAPGSIMVPAKPSILFKMVSPRRYMDQGYMQAIASEVYGGAFRKDPSLIAAHARGMTRATNLGYLYQLIAMAGWTSLLWLSFLKQHTLVLSGRDDPIVRPINGWIMAKLIPNARFQVIDDGHLFVVSQPDAIAEIVELFLRE
jgi:poly(3-hydroxyalkanoate) depolymerase